MSDTRQPIGWATYPGDARNIVNERAKGPNYMGELMWAVTADYDAEANTTRVGFTLLPPPLKSVP